MGTLRFVLAAANFGTLLGGLVATVLRDNLTDEQLASWGWRLPFLSGIVVSFSGFYLRSHGDPEHVPAGPVDTNTEAETTVMKRFRQRRHSSQRVASSSPPVNPAASLCQR
jgi:MFS family permease